MSTRSPGSPLAPLSPASITSPEHQQHYVPASGFMPIGSSSPPMTGVVQAQLTTNQAPLTSPRQPMSAMLNNNASFAMPTLATAAGDSKRVVRPRKSHIKSRKGCGNCKRRRIKCDEEHPQCFNCLKHGVDCDYLGQAQQNGKPAPVAKPIKSEFAPVDAISPSSSVSSPDVANYGMPMTPGTVSVPTSTSSSVGTAVSIIHAPSLSSPTLLAVTPQPASEAASVLPDSESEFATLHMAQLELLHHFLTVTSPTLSDVTDGDLWLTQIPRMAFRHDFLMYAMLTIAATHMKFLQDKAKAASASSSLQIDQDDLASTQERELYFARAEIWYRQRSLETFRAAISGERTAGNLEAMTIAGSLIAIQSFAYHEKGHEAEDDAADGRSPANGTDPQTATIISIDRWLPILLGIRTVVHEMQNMQTGIDLQSIFGIDFSSLASAAESDAPAPLAKLLKLCSTMFAEQQTELEIYMAGIHLLSQLIAAFRHARPAELRKYVFTWPFLLSDEFHARLRLRDPVTLIVFVHFLAVVSLLNAWWQEERVRVDTKEICKLYLQDRKWRPWLEWVIEVLPFNLFE
ncbi:uncharacterized protein V1513DRAFT_441937 [Lipomyces chichibuensis]|uniref:uncharacterized protein n=1 Tax=Lipomyces chichibuensis TaxID=1546026 RepID=UPI0033439CBB